MALRRGIIVDGVKLDRREAALVHEEVYTSARVANRLKMWALVGFAAAVLLPLACLAGALMFAWLLSRTSGGMLVAILLGAGIGTVMALSLAFILSLGFNRLYRREIREAMARLGYALCPGCGYWLKGLAEQSTRCPECGDQWKTAPLK